MEEIEWVRTLGVIVGIIGAASLGLTLSWYWGHKVGYQEGFRDGKRLDYLHPARRHQRAQYLRDLQGRP